LEQAGTSLSCSHIRKELAKAHEELTSQPLSNDSQKKNLGCRLSFLSGWTWEKICWGKRVGSLGCILEIRILNSLIQLLRQRMQGTTYPV